MLYVAPERLVLPQMLELLKQIDLSILAVDEAHCVSEWGHDFRPSYLRLRDARHALGTPQTVALTATATPQVRRDVSRLLELRSPVEILAGFDRPNLTFAVARVRNEGERLEALVQLLKARRGPAVVYAATRRQVNDAAALLTRLQVPVVSYHAGLSPERRASAQSAFMSGAMPVIVATNAFGMGIDKKDVRLVVHYAPSGSLEDYYQEAGRAGRDGAMSRCVLLYHDRDRSVHDRFRETSYPLPAHVRRAAAALVEEQQSTRIPVLEERRIGARCRPALTADEVWRCVTFLVQHGVVSLRPDEPEQSVRLLAAPLRLACELPSLDPDAALVLRAVRDSSQDWCLFNGETLGLSSFALKRALEELESRQLVFVGRKPSRFAVDTSARGVARLGAALRLLTSLRIAERAKLDAVVAYATTTRCRRDFILRYFGDTSPRSHCGRCDNCSRGG